MVMQPPRPRRVHMYMQDWLPRHDGTGTHNRIYSNVRAYLDLGLEVEIIYFQTKPSLPFAADASLPGVKWTHIQPHNTQTNPLDRVAYWLGWPANRAYNYRFKNCRVIRSEVLRREAMLPGVIHHFEYMDTACAITRLQNVNCIWSLHDIESNFVSGHRSIRQELGGPAQLRSEKRALSYLQQAERLVAKRSSLVLCIAKHECDELRQQWGCSNAEFFPMSLPFEDAPARTRTWMQDGKLRLFHLGRIDSLPSFRSLQFILQDVFPLLRPDVVKNIVMIIVGEIRDSERARIILQLAKEYPQVQFAGFQKDIRGFYAGADLQVVGSTEATGLRTRIIESFAYGVPVISTRVGAEGVEGLNDGKNIILVNDAHQFAERIARILSSPAVLPELAKAGLETYSSIYRRSAVASKLSSLLNRYIFN